MQESIIRILNLTKRYKATYALKEINLTMYQGNVFGIIGRSGAGKSTLIRCLSRLENPSEGQIFLYKDELTALSGNLLRKARKNIGMIFQHFNLFSSRNALENIIYPLEIEGVSRSECLKKANELIELVGLKGKEKHYPAQMSGGEKQRVAIARALMRFPAVLLCDEATSALDPHSTHSVLELLSHLNNKLGLTIILITHEMEVIKQICTHVAVLEHGEIVEKGETVELFSNPKHPTTKRFLNNLTHTIPKQLLPTNGDQEVLRLSFTGQSSSQPVISRLIRECNVEVNILLGGIDVLKTGTVGNLVITLSGTPEERLKSRQFLESQGVSWEMVK